MSDAPELPVCADGPLVGVMGGNDNLLNSV